MIAAHGSKNLNVLRQPLILMALMLLVAAVPLAAHPLSQGSLDVTVHSDKIVVHARVTSEEVAVTNSATGTNPLPGPWAATGISAFEHHANYLAAHLHFIADGAALIGRVTTVVPPNDASLTQNAFATYDLEYALPAHAPRIIELGQNVLSDGRFAPGGAWEATYIVMIAQDSRQATAGLLLTRTQPITFVCDWSTAPSSTLQAAQVNREHLFTTYFTHGVHHILTGYDHLLFVSALVLAATSLWDLVKVVSAFTLAHTLTLTLAALDLVRVSERVSEPLISASIVFIAVQNVFWPRQSKGWLRLAAAFFFGLFHGLGFAGGLLDAMHGMQGSTVLLAILAFSIGVETGHQMIVLPLFAGLKVIRETRPTELGANRFSFTVQRLGSAIISLAGLWFLVGAMKLCVTGVAP